MSLVLAVAVLVDIFLLNVTTGVVEIATSVELSVGLTEVTVGRLSQPNFSYSLPSLQLLRKKASGIKIGVKHLINIFDEYI